MIERVIDIKNSIALVQYTDKRVRYIQTSRVPTTVIKHYYEQKAAESQQPIKGDEIESII